jgi:hypothetical protein
MDRISGQECIEGVSTWRDATQVSPKIHHGGESFVSADFASTNPWLERTLN